MTKNIRLDATVTSTRPDLQVNANRVIGPGLPGSFLIVDGKHVPNMDDEAMKNRAVSDQRSAVSKEEKKNIPDKIKDAADGDAPKTES